MANGDNDMTPLWKLIFWFLSALFVTMTSIGSWTAARLIGELDSMHLTLYDLQATVKASDAAAAVYRENLERRITQIERKLDRDRQ